MKISFNWLRELCELPPGVTSAAVGERLTLAGLEVESIERRGREVRGVQVAEVRGVRPHPGAEKLSIVRVRVRGGETGVEHEVVCGAPNVPSVGGLVAWAPPGASLPGGRTLDRREIRGVMSPGMLCSEAELGISDASEGILILPRSTPLGANLATTLGLLDEVLEVNVTPNRPDALSHAGIAREVAALYKTRWKLPRPDEIVTAPLPAGRGVDIEIRDSSTCPRYTARIITGLRAAPSPVELRIRLAACGVRAISNLVDVTNYVMLETGHPLHAFDLDKISGGIVVRHANRAERMTTLDGVERPLQEGDIVIADGRGALALAGVMGGATSEVSAETTAVLLEAATFDPRSVRRTAKRLGLHSEASHRFERSVDANGIPHASLRASAMLARLGGGTVGGELVDRYPLQQHARKVSLSQSGLNRTAGFEIPIAQAAEEKLVSIDIPVDVAGDGLTAAVPSFRPDISIEPDLIEEVMRLSGYDRVPARLPPGTRAPATSPELLANRARDALAAQGLHEAVAWGFVPRPWLEALGKGRRSGAPLADGIAVKNPISSDYEVLRTSLFPGLAEAARRNLMRGVSDVALFEVGPVVLRGPDPKELPLEPTYVAAILIGRRADWLKPGSELDFFDAKRAVDELLRALGIDDASYRGSGGAADQDVITHPGISARIFSGPQGAGREIGLVGEVHPAQRKRFGLGDGALYFEIDLDAASGERHAPPSVSPPRFPAATRDLSFWIGASITADDQRAAMNAAAEPLLRELAVLEDFRDPRYVAPGKKGMLWTMTYRAADRTLTDAEVDAAHASVVSALGAAHPITIR